jgi:hypothetical protein
MTKTEARLLLSQRQRRFEWELARDEQTRAAGRFVSGKTHDLLNLVQIVQLASLELEKRCDETGKEFLADLAKAAVDAQRELTALMEVARPPDVVVPGAPVGPAVDGAIASLRAAIDCDIHLAPRADVATRCTKDELEHILIGLALDVADDPERIELFVRERTIEGRAHIEIVRSSSYIPEGDRFELRAVEAIVTRAGGELATSERRGGGEELVVELPVIR